MPIVDIYLDSCLIIFYLASSIFLDFLAVNYIYIYVDNKNTLFTVGSVAIQLFVSADDYVYIFGDNIYYGYQNGWFSPRTLTIRNDTVILALKVFNRGGNVGVLASCMVWCPTATGVVQPTPVVRASFCYIHVFP